jgi:HK97 family phage prohead protease
MKPSPSRATVVTRATTPVTRAAGGSPGIVTGYAILWDRLSLDLGGFRERIVMGALDDTLKAVREGTHDIMFQYAHDGQHLMGRTSSGHLKLTTDAAGLRYEARLPDTTLARDLYRLIAEGILKGASIGFSLGIDSWDRSGKATTRTIKRLTLWEISLVSRPAYFMTSAQVHRSAPSPGTWAAARLRAAANKPHRMTTVDIMRADDQGIIRR